MLRLSRDKLMEASVIGSGLRQEVLLNEKNLHTINGDNNNNNINGNISWQQLTEMLIYLLSFGANPFDTFQVVRGFGGWRAGTKCYIRMNLLSFARNRNIEIILGSDSNSYNYNYDPIAKGLRLYYKKYSDKLVNAIENEYNLGEGGDIIQISELIVNKFVFGTVEQRYQIGKERFVNNQNMKEKEYQELIEETPEHELIGNRYRTSFEI